MSTGIANKPFSHFTKTHYSSSAVVALGYYGEVGYSIIPAFQLWAKRTKFGLGMIGQQGVKLPGPVDRER